MKIILYIVSFVWVAAGVCYILYTEETRAFIRQLLEEVDRRVLAVIAFVSSVLVLYAAPAATNSWVVVLLGLMGIIKGGVFLANPQNIFDTIREWYINEVTDRTYRFFGIVMLVIGTALFSWIK